MARYGELAASPQTWLVAALAAAVFCAWALLLLGHHATLTSFLAVFAMWNVMMVAMMLPSLHPWLFLFRGSEVGLFVSGYFAVWAVYCLAAAAAQLVLQERLWLNGAGALTPRAGGLLLVAAGVYQLTPLKNACLRRCRSPMGYLMSRWRGGAKWPFRVGLAHGVNCLGCCWALMALAFVLGVMNLWWMAALTLVLAVEKLAPGGELLSRGFGVVLSLWGLVVLRG